MAKRSVGVGSSPGQAMNGECWAIEALRRPVKSLSENRLGEGDSPIFLTGHRKIGTVPDGFRIGSKGAPIASADASVSALQGVLKKQSRERALVWKTENAGAYTM